jgi:hypothetical protein
MLVRILRPVVLALLMIGASVAPAQDVKLQFVDEAANDASWVNFKRRLLAALDKRDKRFVLGMLDRNVRNQTEGARGVAEFRKQWDFDAPESPLWRALSSAVVLGSAYVKREKGPNELCTPYLLARWPEQVDPFTHGAVMTGAALLQAEPTPFSRVLATLSYDLVPVIDWEVADKAPDARQRWVRVRAGQQEGFLPEEQIRSPIEHTACFVKSTNGWRMSGFAPAGGE